MRVDSVGRQELNPGSGAACPLHFKLVAEAGQPHRLHQVSNALTAAAVNPFLSGRVTDQPRSIP
jgi:hypothetical protein